MTIDTILSDLEDHLVVLGYSRYEPIEEPWRALEAAKDFLLRQMLSDADYDRAMHFAHDLVDGVGQ